MIHVVYQNNIKKIRNLCSMTVEQHTRIYVCMYVCGSNVLPNFIDICFK